jgi:Protein of unknown function (DUF2911)
MRHVALTIVMSIAAACVPVTAESQIRASELQTISQIVDGTKVTITYSRPRLRGRDVVFGTRAVRWGEVWTPGANYATTFEVDRDITLAGTPVPKGKYSVWMIAAQDSVWTMLLDPAWRQFHMDHPEPAPRHIKVRVRADSAAAWREEALTFSFPQVTARGATIAMHWNRMRVTMDYTVAPSLSELLPSAEASRYVGRYAMVGQDTTIIITYENGGLKARFDPNEPYFQKFALLRVGPDIFTVGLFMAAEVFAGGEIYEVLRPDFMFTFREVDGKMTFDVRGVNDALYFSARRISP